jgi:hypothetical protein
MRFEPGDLLLFYGRDLSSRVIEWATRGPSHVGIVCPHRLPPDLSPAGGSGAAGTGGEERRETLAPRPDDTLLLFESTTLCDLPCLLTGRPIQGVQAHDPARRIATYRGAVARLRLTRAWRLNVHEIALLHEWLMGVASEPYDLRGALISGTRLFKWSALMPYPDLESLFCSELCAAALMRLHRMPLENPSAFNPASLVREVRRCGTYGAPRFVKRSVVRNQKPEISMTKEN